MAKKKIPGLGLLKEFKDFITRGNVVDLAVGMIIGAAFTAIVTALVTNIFQPLINSIPIGDGVSGLITMLLRVLPRSRRSFSTASGARRWVLPSCIRFWRI